MSLSRYFFEDLTPTDQQQIITDTLNQPPFNRKLSLVGLSEVLQSSIATVQLLCDVLYHIRPQFDSNSTGSSVSQNILLHSNEKTINGPTCAIVNTQNIDLICTNITELILPFFLHVMVLNFQHSSEKNDQNDKDTSSGFEKSKHINVIDTILSDYAIGDTQLISNVSPQDANLVKQGNTENQVFSQEGSLTKPTDTYNIISGLLDHSSVRGELVPPPTAMAGVQQPPGSQLITVGNNIRMHQETSTIIITPTDTATFTAALKTPDACRVLLVLLRQPPAVTRDLIYLSQFKFDYSVPAEYALEPEIQALRTESRQLMSQIIESEQEIHEFNFDELTRLYTKLNSEKRTILERCTKLRTNLEKLRSNIDPQVLDLIIRARHAKDTENDLIRQQEQQKEQRNLIVARNNQLKEAISNSPRIIYDKCIAENDSLHKEVEIDIPKKLVAIRQKMQILSACSSDPIACKEIARKLIQAYMELGEEEETLKSEVTVFDTPLTKTGQSNETNTADTLANIIDEIEKAKKKYAELTTKAAAVSKKIMQSNQKEALFEKELVRTAGLVERGLVDEISLNTNNSNNSTNFSYVNVLNLEKLAESGNKLPLVVWEDIVNKGKRLKATVLEQMDTIKRMKAKNAILQRTQEILSALIAEQANQLGTSNNTIFDYNNISNVNNESTEQKKNINTDNSDNSDGKNSSMENVKSPNDTAQIISPPNMDVNELTAQVSALESELKLHHTALAPRIKELTTQRELAAKLNEQLLITKERVNSLEASSQGSLFKLKAAATKLLQEIEDIESEKVTVEHVNQCLKAELDRAQNEKEVSNLRRQIVAETNNEKIISDQLKQKQTIMTNKIPHMLKQKSQFTSLYNILHAIENSSADKKKGKVFTSGNVNKIQSEILTANNSSSTNDLRRSTGYTTTYSSSENINKQANVQSQTYSNYKDNKMFPQPQSHNMFDITE